MRWVAIGVVLWVGGVSAEAWAQKKRVSEFQAKDNPAADDQARKKGRLAGYAQDQEAPEEPFPWAMVGLVTLIGLLGSPFAYVAWRNSAKELEQQASNYAPAPKKRRREAPDES